MIDYKDVYNIFTDNEPIAVIFPDPETLLQGHLRNAAIALGKPMPEDSREHPIFLYGQQMHGSGSYCHAETDAKVREEATVYIVPKWVTQLGFIMKSIMGDEASKAYKQGKAKGKSLLHRLATGDMSVLNFEDHRS